MSFANRQPRLATEEEQGLSSLLLLLVLQSMCVKLCSEVGYEVKLAMENAIGGGCLRPYFKRQINLRSKRNKQTGKQTHTLTHTRTDIALAGKSGTVH